MSGVTLLQSFVQVAIAGPGGLHILRLQDIATRQWRHVLVAKAIKYAQR